MKEQIEAIWPDVDEEIYSHRWEGSLWCHRLVGGVPSDPKVIKGWLEATMAERRGDLLEAQVRETMEARNVKVEEAIDEVAETLELNGFKRLLDTGELYYEGRQLKAAIKEAANISWPKRRWGPTSKGTRKFFSEHVFVNDEAIPLGSVEPSGTQTRFVKGHMNKPAISREEYVEDVKFSFVIVSDVDIPEKDWRVLWGHGQRQGVGAVRSQGFGTYKITGWQQIA